MALKCLQVANFGFSLSREEIAETRGDAGVYEASVAMKYPEFVDSLALCADLALDKGDFAEKFEVLMKAIA